MVTLLKQHTFIMWVMLFVLNSYAFLKIIYSESTLINLIKPRISSRLINVVQYKFFVLSKSY